MHEKASRVFETTVYFRMLCKTATGVRHSGPTILVIRRCSRALFRSLTLVLYRPRSRLMLRNTRDKYSLDDPRKEQQEPIY